MKTIFLCLIAILVFTSSASAQWVKRDNGRLEWVGEIPGTHKECIRDKLLTGQCFYKFYSGMGFKDERLEEAVNLEKTRLFPPMGLRRIFMAKALQKLCRVSAAVA